VIGKRIVIDVPWRFSSTPAQVTRYAPLLGEHNEYVFGELLGMPQEEIQRLVAEGVIN
jgi:crotonobetainyl-CoA:carnitine CoA-transferase CaiB-like acyl-CoA transferase